MNQMNDMGYLREPQLRELTKLSRSTRWRLERNGMFPKRRRLSSQAVGWLASEVEEWLLTRNEVRQSPSRSNEND